LLWNEIGDSSHGGKYDPSGIRRRFRMRRAFLDNHYDSILSNNREKILEGGTADTLLK
jgi:hypothetical protein